MGERLLRFYASGGDTFSQKKHAFLLFLAKNIPGEAPLGGGGGAPSQGGTLC